MLSSYSCCVFNGGTPRKRAHCLLSGFAKCCLFDITVTSHVRRGILNHFQLDSLFNSLWKQTSTTKTWNYWPVKIKINARKAFPYHDVVHVFSEALCIMENLSETHLKFKSNASITSVTVVQSSCNFAWSTAVTLPCSVQNFKMIG